MSRKGIMFIISAPSGAGKTTLCHKLLEACSGLYLSISYTTRKPRQGEIEGIHYHFVSEDIFKEMISSDEFIEWAKVHDNYYGTAKKKTEEILNQGLDILFDIDVQGGKLLRAKISDTVLIFVLPPNMEILEKRLRGRMSDSEETIIKRIGKAKEEIMEYKYYDYVIVNNTIEDALNQLKSIVNAERLKVLRINQGWIQDNFLTN